MDSWSEISVSSFTRSNVSNWSEKAVTEKGISFEPHRETKKFMVMHSSSTVNTVSVPEDCLLTLPLFVRALTHCHSVVLRTRGRNSADLIIILAMI